MFAVIINYLGKSPSSSSKITVLFRTIVRSSTHILCDFEASRNYSVTMAREAFADACVKGTMRRADQSRNRSLLMREAEADRPHILSFHFSLAALGYP